MNNRRITNILLIIGVSVFLFGAGYQVGRYSTPLEPVAFNSNKEQAIKNQNIDFQQFWDTWQKLEDKYVDKSKLDRQKMMYGAIKGMVAAVDDPYTFFLTPDENKQSKDDLGGKFEGIGAQLGLKEKKIVVIAPLKNSPSEKAGVKPGDVVVEVDGKSTSGWTLPQAVSKIRGPKGTTVKLTVERKGNKQTFNIMRDEIKVDSVELNTEQLSSCTTNCAKVAHLKLNQFGDNTNSEWDLAVEKIRDQYSHGEIKGMVLDLRDNPGGYLDSAVYTASEFLKKNTLVVKQESTSEQSHAYTAYRDGKLQDIPLVVIINKGSASASEILSGALRDNKRAVLIGEKSFGKGSVQEALDLGEGAGLHVTVAKWILPKGEWINGKGIEPQIKVDNNIEEGNTLSRETDKQLDTAISNVLK